MEIQHKRNVILRIMVLLLGVGSIAAFAQEKGNINHPGLILTAEGAEEIRENLASLSMLNKAFEETKSFVDAELEKGIIVPVPKDMAGGFTHERHKTNYFALQKAGVLYQVTKEEKYALYVKNMFLEYAKLYPTLDLHPEERSYARGKIFWQCLNDANWLVYASQAYDCVYDYLTKGERDNLEKNLFIPFANHLSTESPQFFNRIHNHSTWGIAGVGMIGLVMNNQELIDRALNGLSKDNIPKNQKDNDGGLIQKEGVEDFGFLAQIDHLFSPDGYYTEGPYYQRYAMYPFMMLAVGLENLKPEIKIFEYRDKVLVKAVTALLNLTDGNGAFFPLNDAQKGMSYKSRELVAAVDIVYHYGGKNPELLSIAKEQGEVLLDNAGLSVAKDLEENLEKPLVKQSMELRDGSEGKSGGIGIIRSSKGELTLVMKYTAQGEGHGHFDKLSFSLYNGGDEVIPDYGLARFVNIEQKNGGGYLRENKTWAKQTIAHNTLVVNEKSHFNGKFDIGNQFHSDGFFHDFSGEQIQVVSATDEHAIEGVKMHRTMAMISDEAFENPIVLDLLNVSAEGNNQYDLPYYYKEQLVSTNAKLETPESLKAFGDGFGYQHLWVESMGKIQEKPFQLTWLSNRKFYSITTNCVPEDELIFARIGANDPAFNLRREPAIIIRRKDTQNTSFVSVIEAHGSYDPVTEIAKNTYSNIKDVSIAQEDERYVVVEISIKSGENWLFVLSKQDPDKSTKHQLDIKGGTVDWTGPYYFRKNIKSN
ncbi:alginate lyase family protein [Flexithrix dorotheae]|uniref:alginate lyase family protein n=1 Tax=Flexithrix dorotheae TaxID=70993 RepID=UPI000372A05E|nr:alginate lyase family protein [Flexithrix dorotheae]